MKALIEIANVVFTVEVDRTIPKDTIRVGSIDRFLSAMAEVEREKPIPAVPATHAASPAALAPDNGTRRRHSYVKLNGRGFTREDVLNALRNGEMNRLSADDRKLLELRYGLNGLPMTFDELGEQFHDSPATLSLRTTALLVGLGFTVRQRNQSTTPAT